MKSLQAKFLLQAVAALCSLTAINCAFAETTPVSTKPTMTSYSEKQPSPWNLTKLYKVPASSPAPEHQQPGVESVWIEGLPYNGKPTRMLAYYGVPKLAPGEKVPAMVLVHGGGGTAFPEWVKLWVSRGYAAIAVDNCGNTADKVTGKLQRDEKGGPPGWGGFDGHTAGPVEEQWTYHAVADVILGTSFLAAQPGVDKNKIGITGISWGGYLTCIAANIDTRFKFAVPVYGCGFLGEDSAWLDNFKAMGEPLAKQWLSLWDPSQYVGRRKIPFLWVTGTNDFAYPMSSLKKTYELLPPQQYSLCIRVRMIHGHGGHGENPEEIHAFANSFFKKGAPLTRIVSQTRNGQDVAVYFRASNPLITAELNFTRDTGNWPDRVWETVPAEFDMKKQRVIAKVPDGATVYYMNIADIDGLVASSPHVEIAAPK